MSGLAPTRANATRPARTCEFGLAQERAVADKKHTATMPFPPLSKLAVYKGQSPFASSADRPRCKLAALASALEESSAATSPTFITSSIEHLNPSVYSFVRDCSAVPAASAHRASATSAATVPPSCSQPS